MIILSEDRLWNDIERYCKILDDTVVMTLESESKYSISQEQSLSRDGYTERKNEIQNCIFRLFSQVNLMDKLSIALFIFRSVMKKKMYEDNFEDWTLRFKICNLLFFMSLRYLDKYKCPLHVISNESVVIKQIFIAGYTILENQIIFNEQYYMEQKEDTDKFFERVKQISTRQGDLHSYQIVNGNLNKYLDMKGISGDKIKEDALKQYNDEFFSKSQLDNNQSWKQMITSDNKSDPLDDIIIVSTYDFNSYDKFPQNFITNFEAKKCQTPYDTESELIFAYKTDSYVYISKKILNDAQMFIESIISWAQYGSFTKYFFGRSVNQRILRIYNRFMTYKIADLLLINGYILPMETVKGLLVPRIEISNYVLDKEMKNRLGDIDLIVYSEYSKILYLIEFKNYQMMISRERDLSAEVSKVSREKTPERVMERYKYICHNIEICKEILFKKRFEISGVKSIILTTKPCYYFFLNKSETYEYLDWVEFENNVIKKKL